MGHPHQRRESYSGPFTVSRPENDYIDGDITLPFPKLEGLDGDDIREATYEIFFTSCRSSPGFGGKNALSFYSKENGDGGGGLASPKNHGVGTIPNSKIKKALGLKVLKRSISKMTIDPHVGSGSAPSSPTPHRRNSSSSSSFAPARPRRPMTSAEIMRQQMRITEQGDTRLRKTLMRTLVGQMGRRSETIILPLEFLRHLKTSEFNDSHEYHFWQKRQLKILEAGLLLHPSVAVDKSNTFVVKLRDIIQSSEAKSIDAGKNSDTMRALCNAVLALAWRTANGGTPSEVCHWADGFPLNIHLYCSLLRSIFDSGDDTLVIDEVDEILELMKKTWCTLGISRQIHNACFTWTLFRQYVNTGEIEPDLLFASLSMLAEVSSDAKRLDTHDTLYVKVLSSILSSVHAWTDKKLMSYHDYYQRGASPVIENLLSLSISTSKILVEDLTIRVKESTSDINSMDTSSDRVDCYIRSSTRNAFNKITQSRSTNGKSSQGRSEALLELAKETEELALKEMECFTATLKKWHSVAMGIAAVTLHGCYGHMLKKYLGEVDTLTVETVDVLQRAGKLENSLVQMVVEDTVDCEDGGKGIVREMVPYEVDSVITNMIKQWIEEKLKKGKEFLNRSKETETWNPKSKNEPYAQSAVEIVEMVSETVGAFFEIPTTIDNDMVQELADGLEHLFGIYIVFASSCGSKQNYIPALPPLTRCNRDSKFYKLWRKAAPCSIMVEDMHTGNTITPEGHHPRPLTSRGTQRLYIRLNTLYYLLNQLHDLDKDLSLSSREVQPSRSRCATRRQANAPAYFDHCRTAVQTASQNISEVAAYRLIFSDSSAVFYESLYAGDITSSRIKPSLKPLKQNMILLTAMVTERAKPTAMKEVIKACFECFLMVLLAGGPSRVFQRSDHEVIEEDFKSLKSLFFLGSEGLVSEEYVDREAEVVEGVVSLMGQSTEQLMEDFITVAFETTGKGLSSSSGQKLPIPPMTERWNRTDPNTMLRVLCYRDDRVANQFLKKTFNLAKRR